MTRDINLLTLTSLYPSEVRPRYGIFIESRLKRLVQRGGLQASVVAPVPWFPFKGRRWGEYGRIAATPAKEQRQGLDVRHPTFLSLPGVDWGLKPSLMARAALRAAGELMSAGNTFDVIDAHYLYPDGVAAAEVARQLGLPLVLSARGTDVNVVAQRAHPRRRILEAIDRAAAVVTVSRALKTSLTRLGVPPGRITVLRNGVDLTVFRPENRAAARRRLGLPVGDVAIVAAVGNLVEEKRPDLVLEAVARLPGARAILVGRGPMRPGLEQLAAARGLQGRVWFFEEMPQEDLRWVYSAANILALTSEREGWPNVILEAAACGTPVVAFAVGGVPEILANRTLGTMVWADRSPASLANAIRTLSLNPPSVESVREAASAFSWEPVIDEQISLYRRVAGIELNVDRLEVATT